LNAFRFGSRQDHFVDEAAQQGLFLLLRKESLSPQGRQRLTNGLERRLKLLTQSDAWTRGLIVVDERVLSPLEFGKCVVPAFLQFCSNETIVRVNAQKWSLGKRHFIAETLQVLVIGMGNLMGGLLLGSDGAAVDIQLDRRQCLEKCLHNGGIDAISWNMLTDRHAVFLARDALQR